MGNQMKPSLEESGNDSTYEDNKNNLNTIYPLTENLHTFDFCRENASPNDESFSLAYSYNFNCNANGNELVDMEQLEFRDAQNDRCEIQVEKNKPGTQKCEEECVIKNEKISEFENDKEDIELNFEIKNELNTSVNAIQNKIEKSLGEKKECSLFYTTEKIPDIYSENQIIIKIRTYLYRELRDSIFQKDTECIEYQRIKEDLESNKNKRNKRSVLRIKMNIKVEKGRKKKDDSSKRNHNSCSPDNLINKIKNFINDSLIITINKIINFLYSKEKKIEFLSDLNLSQERKVQVSENIIKKINYNFRANRTNKDGNLALLKLTIYDYLSTIISSKYIDLPENFNKLIMDKLLEDTVNKDIFNFIFKELTLDDFLEIIIHKKELEDFSKFNKLDEKQKILLKKLLDENLFGVERILVIISEKYDMKYVNCFTLLIFNLKKFIMNREKRIRTETNKEDEE